MPFKSAVIEAFNELGLSPSHAMFYVLESKYGITKNNLDDNVEKFTYALRDFLGPQGARVILRLIILKLQAEQTPAKGRGSSKLILFLEDRSRSMEVDAR